jgi:chaperone BCS1
LTRNFTSSTFHHNISSLASYLLFAQQVLSGFIVNANEPNSTIPNAMNGTTPAAPAPSPLAMPTDLSSLVALLFSFSALRDWLKLIVIGGFFETCRRFAFSAYRNVIDSFFITAYFEEDDCSYGTHIVVLSSLVVLSLAVLSHLDWMMVWLSKQPSWSELCSFFVSLQLLMNYFHS